VVTRGTLSATLCGLESYPHHCKYPSYSGSNLLNLLAILAGLGYKRVVRTGIPNVDFDPDKIRGLGLAAERCHRRRRSARVRGCLSRQLRDKLLRP
jgi:hypothetical protein